MCTDSYVNLYLNYLLLLLKTHLTKVTGYSVGLLGRNVEIIVIIYHYYHFVVVAPS